jgi:Flp pilus assembly protein TadD
MSKRMALLAVAFMLVACTISQSPHEVRLASPLLDGQELFGATVPPAEEMDILGVSPEMKAFVSANGRDVSVDWLRMKRLLSGLDKAGYLNLQYEAGHTLTAAEAFRSNAGNCLSFTNLFVALARESRLDAQFQIVDVPPIWDSADGWVMLNSHINVIVHRVRMGAPDHGGVSRDYIVDFNTPEYEGSWPRHVVSDRVAFALFYNNRAVEAMRAGDLRSAFANLKLAIEKSSTVASTWVNLGALYSRQQRYESARVAYEQALRVEPSDKSALTNLARLYDEIGDEELAESYRSRIRRYERMNPYYHYALADSAYKAGNYDAALGEIEQAISLKRDDHRFYFLQGLVHYRQGDVARARSSLATAERVSVEDADKKRYADKLAVLGLKNG